MPAHIRRKLGVGPGSMLAWDEEDGHVIVRRASRYSSLDIHQALFPAAPQARTLTELKEGIRADIRRRHGHQKNGGR